MSQHQLRLIALAHIRLAHDTPATEPVLHAISLLDAAMPASGTPARRDAFAWAHETRTVAITWKGDDA